MSRKFLAALPLLALASACAPTPSPEVAANPSSQSRCMFTDRVTGYTVDDQKLYLRVARGVFEVDAAGFCPDLDTGISLGFTPPPGSSQVCIGDWITIVRPQNRAVSIPCRARVERILTQEDVLALPRNLRP